jgi:hypothetical protein
MTLEEILERIKSVPEDVMSAPGKIKNYFSPEEPVEGEGQSPEELLRGFSPTPIDVRSKADASQDPVMEALQRVNDKVDQLPDANNPYARSKRNMETMVNLGKAYR